MYVHPIHIYRSSIHLYATYVNSNLYDLNSFMHTLCIQYYYLHASEFDKIISCSKFE